MKDKTIQHRLLGKYAKLERDCQYGLTHFCDGTPNKSVDEQAQPKPICPKYHCCEIRRHSVFAKNISTEE